jgi:DNA-directed RNA polymerase alpha subunit
LEVVGGDVEPEHWRKDEMSDLIRLTTYCPNQCTAEALDRLCTLLGCSRTVVGPVTMDLEPEIARAVSEEFWNLVGPEEPEAVARVRLEMARPWTDLEWTVRTANCLGHRGSRDKGYLHPVFPPLVTLGDLAGKTERELLAIRNFGRKSLNEVKDRLAEVGLKLREVGR